MSTSCLPVFIPIVYLLTTCIHKRLSASCLSIHTNYLPHVYLSFQLIPHVYMYPVKLSSSCLPVSIPIVYKCPFQMTTSCLPMYIPIDYLMSTCVHSDFLPQVYTCLFRLSCSCLPVSIPSDCLMSSCVHFNNSLMSTCVHSDSGP